MAKLQVVNKPKGILVRDYRQTGFIMNNLWVEGWHSHCSLY